MVENRIKITLKKLDRLNVVFRIHNYSLILRGTHLSKVKLFSTILLPIILFAVFLVFGLVIITSPDIEKVSLPRIIYTLSLLLFYYGIKNLLRLRKSKKSQVKIMPGKIVLRNRSNEDLVILVEDIIEMPVKIEENLNSIIGEIYIIKKNHQPYLLLSVIDNNLKYLEDDLNYISSTFLMILNTTVKTKNKWLNPEDNFGTLKRGVE